MFLRSTRLSSFAFLIALLLLVSVSHSLLSGSSNAASKPIDQFQYAPPIGSKQIYQVGYRFAPTLKLGEPAKLKMSFRLTMTPLSKNSDGYHVRLLATNLRVPLTQLSTNIALTALRISEGIPIVIHVDHTGIMSEIVNWDAAKNALEGSSSTVLNPFVRSVAYDLLTNHNAAQAASRIAITEQAKDYALTYLQHMKTANDTSIDWHGSPVQVKYEHDAADKSVVLNWDSEWTQGHIAFDHQGTVDSMTSIRRHGSGWEIIEMLRIERDT